MMHIYDREWCNLFVYTVNGAALFHFRRDRKYWNDIHAVMAEFWWRNVVPAKHALAQFMADPKNAAFFSAATKAQREAAQLEVVKAFRCVRFSFLVQGNDILDVRISVSYLTSVAKWAVALTTPHGAQLYIL